MIFYNDEGEENGGLIFGGKKVDGTVESFGHLSFDQYDEDQDMALEYSERQGKRSTGLEFNDRPDTPIGELYDRQQAIAKLPAGPAKDSAMRALRAGFANRPRLRLTVDSAGVAMIEFLDEAGKVTKRVTGE
jgi:hypothetical protein